MEASRRARTSPVSSQRMTVPQARKMPKKPPDWTTAIGRYRTCLYEIAAYVPSVARDTWQGEGRQTISEGPTVCVFGRRVWRALVGAFVSRPRVQRKPTAPPSAAPIIKPFWSL